MLQKIAVCWFQNHQAQAFYEYRVFIPNFLLYNIHFQSSYELGFIWDITKS